MANRETVRGWKGEGTYLLHEPAAAPMADYDVYVYCYIVDDLYSAITEYESNYNFAPAARKVEGYDGCRHC